MVIFEHRHRKRPRKRRKRMTFREIAGSEAERRYKEAKKRADSWRQRPDKTDNLFLLP